MDNIEQAREAQIKTFTIGEAFYNEKIDRHAKFVRYEDHVAALVSLSPSTPVDGAEPVAWRYKDESSGIWHYVEGYEPVRREHRQALYAAPLASPEAEARLRERVTEAERLRFEGELDKWMKIIGAGITGYQPEAYAVMDAACRELVSLRKRGAEPVVDGWMSGADFISSYYGDDDEPPVAETNPLATGAEVRCDPIDVATDVACGVGNTYGGDVLSGGDRAVVELGIRRLVGAGWTVAAEARLAQAEGGPAVTGLRRFDWGDMGMEEEPEGAYVEFAALHPQSAAGEEGK